MNLQDAVKVIRENKDKVCFLGLDGTVCEYNGEIYCEQDDAVIFKFKSTLPEELARRLKHESPVEME
jgi:hypothetical protein